MADGTISQITSTELSPSESRDVAFLVVNRAHVRLLEASHQFQDIVMELEWRLRDYLHLTHSRPARSKAVKAAERHIQQRNSEGMLLHAEIVDLERRIQTFNSWLGEGPQPSRVPVLNADLVSLVFARLYGHTHASSDVAEWPTLAAATLQVYARRAGRPLLAGLAPRFNQLGEPE